MGAEAQPDMSGADPAEPGRVTLSGGPALRMVARGVCGVPKLEPAMRIVSPQLPVGGVNDVAFGCG